MRMWMVNPRGMCDKHLLGEHVEMHMFWGTIAKKKNVDGFIEKNLLEIRSLLRRHDALVREMERRGMTHKTPIDSLPKGHKKIKRIRIPREETKEILLSRCNDCKNRHKLLGEVQ